MFFDTYINIYKCLNTSIVARATIVYGSCNVLYGGVATQFPDERIKYIFERDKWIIEFNIWARIKYNLVENVIKLFFAPIIFGAPVQDWDKVLFQISVDRLFRNPLIFDNNMNTIHHQSAL